jgi:hypothetical protein
VKVRIWMLLDRDGLPVVTADSAGELARITGGSEGSIRSAVSHAKKRKEPSAGHGRRPRKWDAVDIDDDEEE